MVKEKVHITERFKRERKRDPKEFDPKSFRTVDPGRKGFTKLVVGCPKGQFDPVTKRCRVGTKVQAVIKERRK
jgi:hypothetical protein